MAEAWDEAWRRVRTRRAIAWGLTSGDETRRSVYLAALEQAEQFAIAAHAVGMATKPVLLFYALSQSGRAISADLAPDVWEIRGHGAKTETAGSPGYESVLDTILSVTHDKKGAYTVVASATGSPVPNARVSVRELWASLPELPSRWPLGDSTCVRFYGNDSGSEESEDGGFAYFLLKQRTQAAFDVRDEDLPALLDRYPAAEGYELFPVTTFLGPRRMVRWPDESNRGYRVLDEIGMRWKGGFYLRPPLGDDRTTPSPLMTWWGLLFGLANLARYHPARWRAALDPDSSPLATVLEEALDMAEWRIPELVNEALGLPERRRLEERMREGV